MYKDFAAAICLVFVIEGLILFASPQGFRRRVEQMRAFDDRRLRIIGGVMIGVGLITLKIVY